MKLDYTLIIKICEGFAIIVSYIIIAILGVFLKNERDQKKNNQNEEDPHVTHKQLSTEKDKIFIEMDKRIETKASKESVENLQCGFENLKKNIEQRFDKSETKVEQKFSEFTNTLQTMAINIAVLAEQRKAKRED